MNTAPPATGAPECDHTSVGVLISSPQGLLVFGRATPPSGIAPVAGHIDQHGGSEQAARTETAEEVGLAVTHLHLLLTQWRPNRCRRSTTEPVGHRWWIYQAQASGTMRPSDREVRAPRWMQLDQLQQQAHRTAAYAEGRLTDKEFTEQPGLEPVWVRFLHELQLITLDAGTLNRIDKII